MKKKNQSLMQRAMGIIEGVSFCIDSQQANALATALEMLESVAADEDKERR